MKPDLSQRTLGILREILEGMQPEDIITPYENRKFWKDALFDFGFAKAIIDMASTYDFHWSDIIPDLYVGKFGDKNSHFSNVLPPHFCEQTLKQLLAFALHCNRGTPQAEELLRSLAADGFELEARSGLDSSVPAELAQIPGKSALVSDLQQKLDARELAAVLFMDLDGFKEVNDTTNHAEGDKCLIRVARTMSAAILGKGKLYRPGGDEFVAVLPNFSREEAASTAERIRAAIDSDNPGGAVKVTVSIGVASSESTGATDAEALITLADEAMYKAKETKNRVVVATEHRISERASVLSKGTSAAINEKIPVGTFVQSKLDAAKRHVAKSGNAAGLVAMYPEVARAVVSEYPGLTAEQRQAVFASLKNDAELTKVRVGLDSTTGLGEVARILGTT